MQCQGNSPVYLYLTWGGGGSPIVRGRPLIIGVGGMVRIFRELIFFSDPLNVIFFLGHPPNVFLIFWAKLTEELFFSYNMVLQGKCTGWFFLPPASAVEVIESEP